MAFLYGYEGFDQGRFDLSALYYSRLDSQFREDSFIDYGYAVLPDSYVIAYQSRFGLVGTLFAGRDFRFDGGRAVGGTVNLIGEVSSAETVTWMMGRVAVPLAEIQRASETLARADDGALIARVLSGNDRMTLSDDADRASGMAGDDTLFGNAGADTLGGGAGNDRLFGGAGADRLLMDAGADRIAGGAGIDWLVVQGAAAVRVDLARTGAQATGLGRDTILQVENVQGGAGADRLFGDAGANALRGGRGDDRLFGRAADDTLEGGDGADHLDGGLGADRLLGGAGSDVLIGGLGADVLTGGSDADRFVFRTADDSTAAAMDRIVDFRQGEDLIDLSGIDADRVLAGDQAFRMAEGPDDASLTVRELPGLNQTRILLDMDADGRADAVIRLTGLVTLTEADFIL